MVAGQELGDEAERAAAELRRSHAATATIAAPAAHLAFLAGGGQIGRLIRSTDWSQTPLGPPETWPQSLRTSVSICLNCSFPILIWWGEALVKIYNDAYSELLVDKHPWALGQPGALVWPEIWSTIGPMLRAVMERGEPTTATDLLLWLDRRGYPEECYFTFSYSAIRDEAGRIVGVFCPVVETTRRVLGERRAKFLLELEERLRGLPDVPAVKREASRMIGLQLGAAQAGYAEFSPDGNHVLVEADWTDGSVGSLVGRVPQAAFGARLLEALRAGRTLGIADLRARPELSPAEEMEGAGFEARLAFLGVPLIKGGVMGAILFAHRPAPHVWTDEDVILIEDAAQRTWAAVEYARAEAALRQSEQEFRALGENLPNLCWMAKADGRIYWFNNRCCEFSGMTQDELAAGGWQRLHDPALFPIVMERWAEAIENGTPFEMTFPLTGADGVPHPFLTRVVPLRDHNGATTKWFGTNVDISEQRATEERLRLSETRARLLNETLEQQIAARTAERDRMWRLSTDVMLVSRLDGTITAANPAWYTLLGWQEEQLVGTSFLDLIHPEDTASSRARLVQFAIGETLPRYENRFRHRDGSYRWLSWASVSDQQFIHAVGRDVTAEKAAALQLETAQERLRQAQRMEALGQLAGGIAHDFNNVLQAIAGGLSLIQRRAGDGKAVLQIARMAEDAAARGAAVTGRLLAFARKDRLTATAIAPGELLEGLREMLVHTLGSSIAVRTEWQPSMPPMLADKAQLETVLVNLAVNARDAMNDGGTLTLSVVRESAGAPHTLGLLAGRYLRLTVADTGSGMDQATLARAGDPFFTTKPVGQGTGLGLAMARGFAQQSGGGFAIESEPGRGTRVMLWLPEADPDAVAEPGPRGDGATPEEAPGVPVLLVDDEPIVRETLALHLTDRGFAVSLAADGLDALAQIDGGYTPSLLITDFAMPGMNGLILLNEARKRLPALPALLLTGYADPKLQAGIDEIADGRTSLLRKPTTPAQLIAAASVLLECAPALPP